MAQSTFEVSKRGLAQLLRKRGVAFAIIELVQNALDEKTTIIRVELAQINQRRYRLTVEDDNPEGFADLTHAYTLFAESLKKDNPEQRGRFNLGEKLVIAICDTASIATTKGTVTFDAQGRHHGRTKTEAGTTFQGEITMTKADAAEIDRVMRSLIIPAGVRMFFNGTLVPVRRMIHSLQTNLPTMITDEEGNLRPTRRNTRVHIYEPFDVPRIYEMGLPVVECDSRFDIDVQQKVPLNMERDNVTPAYLRELRTAVLNEMHQYLTPEEATTTWVNEALGDDKVSADAVEAVMTKRFGVKRVAYDPSDPEANKLAVSKGFTVIPGRSLSRDAWKNVKRFEAVRPAGQVTPSPVAYSTDPDAPVVDRYSREKWTPGMERIVAWTQTLGDVLLGMRLRVELVHTTNGFVAAYARGGHFDYNVFRLGVEWFNRSPHDEEVLRLIIHEFAHENSSDHLSSDYHDALCRLGARLANWAHDNPEAWRAA